MLERITEIDAHTFEIEGSESAVNDYLAKKDPAYLRTCDVVIIRNTATNTVVARVTGNHQSIQPVGLLVWQRDENGRLHRQR